MKKSLWLLSFFYIIFISCEEESKTTYFSAEIPDAKNKSIQLVPVDKYFMGLDNETNFPSTKIDSTGFLSFEIENFEPGFYQLLSKNYPWLNYDVYLNAGDSIFVKQSSWQDEPNFEISGNGAEKLQPLVSDYKLFARTKAFNNKISSNDFATEMDFKSFIDSIYNPRFKLLENTNFKNEQIKNQLKQHLDIERANYLFAHLKFRNYYMNDEFSYYIPNEEYVSFIDSIGLEKKHLNTKNILDFARNFLTYKAQKQLDENPDLENRIENLDLKWEYIVTQKPSYWNDILILSTIKEFSFAMMGDGFFNEFSNYKTKLDTSFYEDENQKLFKINAEPFLKLSPGNEAPDFALPDADGKTHKLSDYRGKIVYLDFWGTWCGPCIDEIPASLALHEKYKDEPVVFLNVALEYGEKDIERWKKFIAGESKSGNELFKGKSYTGVHLVAEKQFNNPELNDYLINFAPTYVLVDHEGNLVNARAPRPKQIEDDLNLLLEKMKSYE